VQGWQRVSFAEKHRLRRKRSRSNRDSRNPTRGKRVIPRKGKAAKRRLTWAVALLFPVQGQWSEEEYLALESNRLVELSDGFLDVLRVPRTSHQLLVGYLYGLLVAFAGPSELGTVLFVLLRVRLWRGKVREPDMVFMLKENAGRIAEDSWSGADLVMEVVCEGDEDRRRDL
jgi:Uma2 family endonuclease